MLSRVATVFVVMVVSVAGLPTSSDGTPPGGEAVAGEFVERITLRQLERAARNYLNTPNLQNWVKLKDAQDVLGMVEESYKISPDTDEELRSVVSSLLKRCDEIQAAANSKAAEAVKKPIKAVGKSKPRSKLKGSTKLKSVVVFIVGASVLAAASNSDAAEKEVNSAFQEMVNENGGGFEGAVKGLSEALLPDDVINFSKGDVSGGVLSVITYGFYSGGEDEGDLAAKVDSSSQLRGANFDQVSRSLDSSNDSFGPAASTATSDLASMSSQGSSEEAISEGIGNSAFQQPSGTGEAAVSQSKAAEENEITPDESEAGSGNLFSIDRSGDVHSGTSTGMNQGAKSREGSSGLGSSDPGFGEENGPVFDSGGEELKDRDSKGGGGDSFGNRSLMGSSGSSGEKECVSNCGGDGGMPSPEDVDGVDDDRARIVVPNRLVDAVGGLVSLIASGVSAGAADRVTKWSSDDRETQNAKAHNGGLLNALEALFAGVLHSRSAGHDGHVKQGVLGIVDLATSWGSGFVGGSYVGGVRRDVSKAGPLLLTNKGTRDEDGGVSVPSRSSNDRTATSRGGRRADFTHTVMADAKAVQPNHRTVPHGQRRTMVEVPAAVTTPQWQKLVSSRMPTSVDKASPAQQVKSPVTKLSGSDSTTSHTQNPSTELSYRE